MAGIGVSKDFGDEIAFLESMFGGTISAAVIATVIESYDGNVHLAADAIMNFSNELSTQSEDCNDNANLRSVQTIENTEARPARASSVLNVDAPSFQYPSQEINHLQSNIGNQQSALLNIPVPTTRLPSPIPIYEQSQPNAQQTLSVRHKSPAAFTPTNIRQHSPTTSNPRSPMFSRQQASTSMNQPKLKQEYLSTAAPLSLAETFNVPFAEKFRNSGTLPRKPPDSKPEKPIYTKKYVWNDPVEKIVHFHYQGARILVIMRGASGSGKTHLAKHIVDNAIGPSPQNYLNHIFSTDNYFMRRGYYQFNRDYLEDAHANNQRKVCEAANKGVSPIIVDNTNTELWEMEPYIRDGVRNGYMIEFVEPNTPWARNANQLERRNSHGVPRDSIRRMLDRYDKRITPESAMKALKLSYPRNRKPPVLRNFPSFSPPGSSRVSPKKEIEENVNVQHADTIIQNSSNERSGLENPPHTVPLSLDGEIPSTSHSIHEKNDYETRVKKIIEAQRKIEQLEKVEQDWDNGESWEVTNETKGSFQNVTTTIGNIVSEPKPPRESENKDTEKMIDPYRVCDDWTKIAMFMPPWQDSNNASSTTTKELQGQLESRSIGTGFEFGDIDELGRTVLYGNPRDINKGIPEKERPKIPKMIVLDKSTSTYENDFLSRKETCKNKEYHFKELRRMFKSVPRKALRDIFESCNFDVNWAVDLVLDSYRQYVNNDNEHISDDDVEENGPLEDCNCLADYNIVPNVTNVVETDEDTSHSSEPQDVSKNTTPQRKSKREPKLLSENSLQLKRQIESNVMISDNHYSQHYLNMRRRRENNTNDSDRASRTPDSNNTNMENVAQANLSAADTDENNKEGKAEALPLPDVNRIYKFPNDFRDVAGPSNAHYNLDFLNADKDSDTESDSNKSDMEKTVAINLGQECIQKLDELFGRKNFQYPENIKPTVFLPMSILQQINAYWAMSVASQMDDGSKQTEEMIKQDEEFARQLAAKEREMSEEGKEPEIPTLREIMDMELAYSIYERGIAEWRNNEPQDMAARMSREKLYNLFPDLTQDLLSEMLMAHNYDFKTTVELVLMSTNKLALLNEEKAIEKFVLKKEMERKEKYLIEQKKNLDDSDWIDDTDTEHPVTLETVEYFRSEAERSLRFRNENFEKARQYFSRNSPSAAAFYSDIAALHTRKYEHYSCLAAAYLMKYHVKNNPDNEVLDLHFLRVSEAMVNLDLFIDRTIQILRTKSIICKEIFIITGKGNHSVGGPRIKPATKRRLRDREIPCKMVNGGLLSARIYNSHKLTNELNENS